MRHLKSLIGIAVVLALLYFIPSPVSRFFRSVTTDTTQGALHWTGNALDSIPRWWRVLAVYQENKQLRNRLGQDRQLAVEVRELRAENERLRALLNFEKNLASRFRNIASAEVVGRSPAGWGDTVIINKGALHGLKNGMPVVAEAGLIGRISETGKRFAKVRLLTHPSSRIGAISQRTRHTGVIYGAADGECRMKYLALDADVRPGDVIETAGLSSGFPKGLMIGQVTHVWKETGKIYKVASVKLFVDLGRLEELTVMGR